MYFDERRALSQPHRNSQNHDPLNSSSWQQNTPNADTVENQDSYPEGTPSAQVRDWRAANMVDSANNKLQELMQLLYLLSRDPGVPKDARYHVTVAQGEIALLAHVMRNNAQAEGAEPVPSLEDQARHAAHP